MDAEPDRIPAAAPKAEAADVAANDYYDDGDEEEDELDDYEADELDSDKNVSRRMFAPNQFKKRTAEAGGQPAIAHVGSLAARYKKKKRVEGLPGGDALVPVAGKADLGRLNEVRARVCVCALQTAITKQIVKITHRCSLVILLCTMRPLPIRTRSSAG